MRAYRCRYRPEVQARLRPVNSSKSSVPAPSLSFHPLRKVVTFSSFVPGVSFHDNPGGRSPLFHHEPRVPAGSAIWRTGRPTPWPVAPPWPPAPMPMLRLCYATVNESISGGWCQFKIYIRREWSRGFRRFKHTNGESVELRLGPPLIGGKAGDQVLWQSRLWIELRKGGCHRQGSGQSRFRGGPSLGSKGCRWVLDDRTAISDPLTDSTHGPRRFRVTLGSEQSSGDKGWIKINVGPSGNSNAGVAITVEAYAYNSTPGGSIDAGDTGADARARDDGPCSDGGGRRRFDVHPPRQGLRRQRGLGRS